MTLDDVKVIFNNVEELAFFSDYFTEALEDALGEVLDGGSGEDRVGKLFLETVSALPSLINLGAYALTGRRARRFRDWSRSTGRTSRNTLLRSST